jgi:potassium efflux system protein
MIRPRSGRAFRSARRFVAVAAALAIAGIVLARAQAPSSPDAQAPATVVVAGAGAGAAENLEAIKSGLDGIEKSLGGSATEDELAALQRRLTPIADELRERLAALDSSLKEVDRRHGELGAPPAAPGDAAVAAERTSLAARRAELDAAMTAAKALSERAGDLAARINDARRAIFANHPFARGASMFDQRYWDDLVEAVEAELHGLAELMALWIAHVRDNGGAGGALGAAAVLAALGGIAWLAARRLRRLHRRSPVPARFGAAMTALGVLVGSTARLPVAILATVLVLRNFGLMPDSIVGIGFGLAAAAAAAGFGRGVAAGLFAPGAPDRRIIAIGDREAASCAAHLAWGARAFALAVFLSAVHRALGAPFAPMVATGELLALAVLGIAIHFLWRSAKADLSDQAGAGAAGRGLAWLRAVLWVTAIAIATALATGYVGVAVFLAGRLLMALAIGGAVTILIVLIDALTELVAADTPQGRGIAALFGLSPRGLELAEILLSAALRLVVILLAVLLVIGSSGTVSEDVFGLIRRVTSDYAIGGVSLSPLALLSALALLALGGIAVRGAQRWLQTQFLPRTGLDAGLQNSIAALFGYAALIAVLALALSALGIDLQKIALIAGALSVGIGFGLQSVVSNFVCGLILLAERPIRVGDWVVVRNEEGWVRRIRVRATEIETFDRASVIIPNQEFITGVVKNWTHGNTMGRIIIKVRVAYDSDLDKVRETLLGCAAADPRVLHTPPPVVYLIGFGDIGIDFELRCLLGNVEQSLGIKSDVQTDVMRKFAEGGIRIPFPAHEARPPGPAPPAAT